MKTAIPIQTNPRVASMERILANFPEKLVLTPQWVLWKLVIRGGKTTKLPYQLNGMMADSTSPATWSDFTSVMTAYLEDDSFNGIGFVFSADDPYAGIDLDKCRDPISGEVEPWATEILSSIDTYTELSPSGKGFHLIGKAKLPDKGRKKGHVEMYDSDRYFTVTGDKYGDSASTVAKIQDDITALHRDIFGDETNPATAAKLKAALPSTDTTSRHNTPQADDHAVVDAILASSDATIFKQFKAGNWTALGYPSQSEGDLALAGMLARHTGGHPDQIDRIFRITGMIRDKWDESRGTNTYGEITIAKALESMTAISPLQAFLNQMNERFAVIKNGNQVRILEEATNNNSEFGLFSKSDFDLLTIHLPFPDKCKSAASAWLHHPQRRQYERLVFSPERDSPSSYNLWRGFSVQPAKGNCDFFWQFVSDAICAGSADLYNYVRRYFAHMIQRPWERPEVALVMRGGQGTGKNTFTNTMGSIVNKHFCEISSVDQLTGRFNAHLRNVILLHANEATWGGNKSESGKLKALITDPTIPIEMKGNDIFHVDNYLRIVISSNNAWPVPIEADDRRFLPLDIAPTFQQDTKFFAALHAQLNNGGREALMHDLQTEDISNFSPRNKPSSPFGADMKIRSADSPTRWLFECLNSNTFIENSSMHTLFTAEGASASVSKGSLFFSYEIWCKTSPDRYFMGRDLFFRRLRELLGTSISDNRPTAPAGQTRERMMVLSSLGACRLAFEAAAGVKGAVTWEVI